MSAIEASSSPTISSLLQMFSAISATSSISRPNSDRTLFGAADRSCLGVLESKPRGEPAVASPKNEDTGVGGTSEENSFRFGESPSLFFVVFFFFLGPGFFLLV